MHATTRSKPVHEYETHDQRNGADHFKIENRQASRFAHGFHVFHTGDTNNNRAEDHRRNDHFD